MFQVCLGVQSKTAKKSKTIKTRKSQDEGWGVQEGPGGPGVSGGGPGGVQRFWAENG